MFKKKFKLSKKSLVKYLANLLIGIGVGILILTFSSPIFQETKYIYKTQNSKNENKEIIPVDTDFGIVIPKINANAKIFPNIDPYDEQKFLPVLKMGVAHAKGTAFPGQGKNIYLFAHSTDAFYNVGYYNAVFYLIRKLIPGDEINIFYHNKLFIYTVFDKKVISPKALNYLRSGEDEVLTLQTCYPPGTTLKRLIVRAKLK